MADGVNKFLGDTPGRTIVKLIVVCLVVGFVLAFFGFTPDNIVSEIVIPIFVILRLMSYRR
jgi:nucleoside recognition membrane protein YjiH